MPTLSNTLDDWLPDGAGPARPAGSPAAAEQVGRVEEVGDGIAYVSGLTDVRLDELLALSTADSSALPWYWSGTAIGCVLLDAHEHALEAGDTVHGTGEVVRVPVGRGVARPRRRSARPAARRHGPSGDATRLDPIERPAPSIIERDLVTEPCRPGSLVIDALFAARPGPARADRRRPRHRQDHTRDRHHHQPA